MVMYLGILDLFVWAAVLLSDRPISTKLSPSYSMMGMISDSWQKLNASSRSASPACRSSDPFAGSWEPTHFKLGNTRRDEDFSVLDSYRSSQGVSPFMTVIPAS